MQWGKLDNDEFQTEGVSNFKERLKEDDEKGAVEEVKACSSKVEKTFNIDFK